MASKWTRWIPAAMVATVAVAGAVVVPIAADASPALPEKSPQQLLEFVAGSAGTAYSGTVDQSSNLGLPDLSSIGSSYGHGGGTDSPVSAAVELLTGSQSARVFVGGVDTARIQIKDTLAERDVIRNGNEAWTYDSKSNEVQHITATAGQVPDTGLSTTPAELASQLLAGIDSSTAVSVTETARVAGRSVYQLVLTPNDNATLVGSVTLSIDSETGLPLEVQVAAAGQDDAAFSLGFSSIDFTAPDASLFSFVPPAGATVVESQLGDHSSAAPHASEATKPTTSGTGWATIVELPAGSAGDIGSSSPLLDQVLTTVSDGRALETSLVSVLLTSDGRVFVGAVGVDQLQAAAAK